MVIQTSDNNATKNLMEWQNTAGTALARVDAAGKFYGDGSGLTNLPGSSAWVAKTANYTAVAGDRILADTSGGAFTITLPASASQGDTIEIIDASSSFGTNNLTIARNGLKIMGLAEDMTASTTNAAFTLVYYNATNGWRLK
jgi:hypothetical protein